MRHGLPPRPPEDGEGPIIRPLVFWALMLLLGLVLTKCGLKAQVPSGYQVVPDCQIAFFLTQPNQVSAAINNTQVGCTSWAVQYSTVTTGPGPALQLDFQSALDAGGSPGTYGLFAGTVLSGANPMVTVGGYQATFLSYAPWVRLRLVAVNNVTVRGVVYGWKAKPRDSSAVAAIVGVNNFPANQAVTVTNTNVPVNLGDTPNIDAFSRLRVSQAETLFDSQQEYLLNPYGWTTATATGGSTTYNSGRSSTSLTTTNAIGSRAVAQTRAYLRYQPGKSQLVLITVLLGTNQTGNAHRAGQFDDNNGLFFEVRFDGANQVGYVVRRSDVTGAPVDDAVPQNLWNIDPMDGSGPSGVTVDWNDTQILVMDYQWLGVGRVRMGLDIDGVIYPVHQFLNANIRPVVYTRTINLPIRYENINTGAASGGSSMEAICSTVMSEGGFELANGITRSASTAATTYSVGSGVFAPVLCIRPTLLYQGKPNRAKIIVEAVSVLGSSNTRWALVYYGTPAGGVFVPLVNSVVETDGASEPGTTRSTAIAGGIVVAQGFIGAAVGGARNAIQIANNSNLPITISFDGLTQDYVCVCAQGIGGATTVSASIDWREIY